MSQSYILAGVGNIQLIDKSSAEIVATSKTLTDSGISFAVTAEDIRGGLANKLLGQYFHDSGMSLTLTDALFNMGYLALNVGGTISVGGDVMTTVEVTTTEQNQIKVVDAPKDFMNMGTIGWYSVAGKDTWSKITFEDTTANVPDLPRGTTVCVKYVKNDDTVEQFTVSSAFIPSQCYALLTLPLFKSGTDTNSYSSSSKVGEVQVEIPTFLLGGAQELSLTSSGAATTALSGNALATFSGNEGCDGEGYYAKLKQIIFNKDEFADVKSIVVADSNIELGHSDSQKIEVYAIYGGAVAPKLIDNSKLTFTAEGTSASVNTEGVVSTESTDGVTTIEVVVKGKTSLTASAVVTVSE